ncbi:hypothetical protein FOZ63_017419, partial [Perkinsus olseni]
AHNNALADRAQELEGQLTQAEDLCRRYDEEVIRRMRQIDKRQLMVERLNKEYDDKRSGLAGMAAEEAEALGPLEAKIRGIRNEIDECRKKSEVMQKKWILSQSELMSMNDDEEQMRQRNDILYTKIIILDEKLRRLMSAIEQRVKDNKLCNREIRQLREDMLRINKRIGEYREKEGRVGSELKDIESRMVTRLS